MLCDLKFGPIFYIYHSRALWNEYDLYGTLSTLLVIGYRGSVMQGFDGSFVAILNKLLNLMTML